MLRDRKQPQSFTFSKPKQIVVWSCLIALGLFIAGIRGPAAAVSAVQAAQPDATVPEATPGANTKHLALDYVPDDALLVVAVRPGDLLASDAGKLILQAIGGERAKFEKAAGLSISDVEQATFVQMHPDAARTFIIRSRNPHDWTSFAATLVPHPVETESTLPALAGKKYLKSAHPTTPQIHSYPPVKNSPLCYFQPDDRTVVFAPESEIDSLLACTIKTESKPSWDDLWQRAATGKIACMINVKRFRTAFGPMLQQNSGDLHPFLAMLGPAWTESQRIFVGTDLGDKKLGLLALDQCSSDEAASQVERTCQALITLGLNGLAAVRGISPHNAAEMAAMKHVMASAAEELLKATKLSRDGRTVVAESQASRATLLAVASITLPAVHKAREAARRSQSMNNLKQLAIAMFLYNGDHGHFPPAVVMGPDGKTPHSWRVELLPYLGQDGLHKQYKFDEPWDSPANKKVLAAAPPFLHSPADNDRPTDASYFVLTGKETMFSGNEGIKQQEITGGMSNTIMIVEAKRDIPWTKPEDIPYDPAKPLPKLGGIGEGGYGASFADGSVRFIANNINELVLRALISPAAKEKQILNKGSGGNYWLSSPGR